MPGFDGTGPAGAGPMTGGGRGFCNPWGIATTPGTYGIPRARGYGYPYYRARPFIQNLAPFAPRVSREQEIGWLKQEAQAMREHLKEIESRVQELANDKNKE